MLTVKTPEEVFALLREKFHKTAEEELVPLEKAFGRVTFSPVVAAEYVPGFDRSTVDGYAVSARDTFGCSDALPALLTLVKEIRMGESAGFSLAPGECAAISTGGALPENADAAVMVEHTESYGDGTIGILKPAAPGENLIKKGEDIRPGKEVIPAGRRLNAQDIGALAAMGITKVPVTKRLRVGILSTGDELVPVDAMPGEGEVRDINSSLLSAFLEGEGAEPHAYGILRDDETAIGAALDRALEENDMVLISGGSSAGVRDATCRIMEARGDVFLHGIAVKPGKPTIFGRCAGRPVFGLPGHPGAAYRIAEVFVRELLAILEGRALVRRPVRARLSEPLGSNHGRAEYAAVKLREEDGTLWADPIHTKSGLISSLAGADGYIFIGRDTEGLMRGTDTDVYSDRIE